MLANTTLIQQRGKSELKLDFQVHLFFVDSISLRKKKVRVRAGAKCGNF